MKILLPRRTCCRSLRQHAGYPWHHNMQNFEIIIVDDRNLLERLGNIRTRISEEFLREVKKILEIPEYMMIAWLFLKALNIVSSPGEVGHLNSREICLDERYA